MWINDGIIYGDIYNLLSVLNRLSAAVTAIKLLIVHSHFL